MLDDSNVFGRCSSWSCPSSRSIWHGKQRTTAPQNSQTNITKPRTQCVLNFADRFSRVFHWRPFSQPPVSCKLRRSRPWLRPSSCPQRRLRPCSRRGPMPPVSWSGAWKSRWWGKQVGRWRNTLGNDLGRSYHDVSERECRQCVEWVGRSSGLTQG